jgi:Flp pilus assembly pilin Flp
VQTHERGLGFLREESAQGLVEYALILGIIAVAVIISMVFMREQLLALFTNIGNTVGHYPDSGGGACQGQQQQGQCP